MATRARSLMANFSAFVNLLLGVEVGVLRVEHIVVDGVVARTTWLPLRLGVFQRFFVALRVFPLGAEMVIVEDMIVVLELIRKLETLGVGDDTSAEGFMRWWFIVCWVDCD